MEWLTLNREGQVSTLVEESFRTPVLIFKHSTRCSISAAALGRMERGWARLESENIKPYYLDLLRHRQVSNEVAEVLGVEHESPQAILLMEGQVRHVASHYDIRPDDLATALGRQAA